MRVAAFRRALMEWFRRGHRPLPWRATRDPYRIWVSEIMLQQTRAAAAIPFYHRFLERFPTVETLARAAEQDVLAAWSGLGYYSRARNLRSAAVRMAEQGAFPSGYAAIRELPGVGDYTAAAVASIAFGLPHAVLDGNVFRVVARVTNDGSDIGAPATRLRFQEEAAEWLDRDDPGTFNQAVMELGATVCLPRAPLCLTCPVSEFCAARREGTQNQLPVKLRKQKQTTEAAELVVVERSSGILMRQRDAAAKRMAGFWELPGLEDLGGVSGTAEMGRFKHTIVGQTYTITVFAGKFGGRIPKGWRWVERAELGSLPVTTITRKALACGIVPDL